MMSGYKRVNYYELCRLCTSTEGNKIHIFKEEGRRRQVPTKIKRCLPLKVLDHDVLPKMICNACIIKLEEIDNFRQLCLEAEKMLQDFRATFRSAIGGSDGKLQVYVKDSQSQIIETTNLSSNGTTVDFNNPHRVMNSISEPERRTVTELVVPSRVHEESRQGSLQCTVPLKLNGATSVVPVNVGNLSSLMQVVPNDDMPRIQHFKIPIQAEMAVVGQDSAATRYSLTLPIVDAVSKNNANIIQSLQCAVNHDGTVDVHKMQSTIATSTVSFNDAVAVSLMSPPPAKIIQNGNIQDFSHVNMTKEEPVLKSCSHCGKLLCDPSDVCNHMAARPTTTTDSASCEANSTSVIQTVLPKPSNKAVKDLYSEENGYECDICQKPFRKKEHLFQHRKLHSGDRPYVCGSCGKSFSRKEHLFRHMLAHTGEKRHSCNYCGKTFSRKDNLHKHRKIHGFNGPYECELCGKSFIVQHYFLMHQANHSNMDAEEMPFQCNICKKGFVKEEFLNRHKARHRIRNLPQLEQSDLSTLNPVALLSPGMVQQNLCVEETVYVSEEPTAYSITTSVASNTTTATQTHFSTDLTSDGQLLDDYRQLNSTVVSS